MTMWRLESIAPDVAGDLIAGSEQQLRRVAERLVGVALAEARVTGAPVEDGLSALTAGQFGDGPTRDALKRFVDELDVAAWDLQDRVEEGLAEQTEYLAAFVQARAAMALWFALDGNPLAAAMEAAYEAEAATDELVLRREAAAIL